MTNARVSVLTASLAVACGCAGFDARALVPAVVLRAAVERRSRAAAAAEQGHWSGTAEVGLTWSDTAVRRADALGPAPLDEDAEPRSAPAAPRAFGAALLVAALLAAPGVHAQEAAGEQEMDEGAEVETLDPHRIARAM